MRDSGRPGRCSGKVVVVTGAARGQGAAEARALSAEGAVVVATDVLPFDRNENRTVERSERDNFVERAP